MSNKKYLFSEADKILEKLYYFANSCYPETNELYIKVYNYLEENKKGYRLYINGKELEYYTRLDEKIIDIVYEHLCNKFDGVYDETTGCIKLSNPSLFKRIKKRK